MLRLSGIEEERVKLEDIIVGKSLVGVEPEVVVTVKSMDRHGPDSLLLAIVLVDPDDDDAYEGPFYIRDPFDCEPGWGVDSSNYSVAALLERAASW